MSYVLFVEPSSSGTGLVHACVEMGLQAVLLTANTDDRRLPDDILALADHVIVADTACDDQAINAVLRFQRDHPLAAVVPGFEYFVPLAAKLAHALKLPGLDPAKVENVRYKHMMRETVRAAGLSSPRFAVVDSVRQGTEHAAAVGFPMVVKPVGWSGSLFVAKINSPTELEAHLEQIFHNGFAEYGITPPQRAILEEYMTGKEFSIEGYVFNDSVEIVSITEKFLGKEPNFVEVGHITPVPQEQTQSVRIKAYVTEVARALDISVGPFHCEIRDCDSGPILIEIGARLAGDHICELIHHSTGIDMCKISIAAFLGDGDLLQRHATQRHAWYSGIRYFIRPELQSYDHLSGIDSISRLGGFNKSSIDIAPRQPIPPGTNSLGRLGYVIYTQPDYHTLRDTLEQADQMMKFVPSAMALAAIPQT